MPAIGSHNFVTLRGRVEQFGEILEEITRPGQNGVSLRKMGERGPVFRLVSSVDASNAASAQTLYESYKTTQGTVVDITDDRGVLHSNYAVLGVSIVGISQASMIVGNTETVTSGGSGFILSCAWSMRAAGDPSP